MMPNRKIAVRTLIVLVCLLSIPFILQFFLQSYLNSSIVQLEQEMERATRHVYQIKVSKVSVNIFSSEVYIHEFIASAHDSTNNTSVLKSDELRMKGFGLVSYFMHKKIAIDLLEVKNAEINIRIKEGNTKTKQTVFLNPYELIHKKLKSIFIKKINIGNTTIRYYQELTDSVPSLISEKSILLIENLLIDSVTTYTYHRWFNADKFLVLTSDFKYITKDSLYTLRFSQISISYRDSTIEIDSARMIPNYNEMNFAHQVGEQTDRIYAESEKIILKGMDVKMFLEKRKIMMSDLIISHFHLMAFRDKNMQRIEKRIPTLQEVIKKIPLYIQIDSVHLNDSKISYREIAPGSKTAGVVYFSKLTATFYNLTNDSLKMDKDFEIHAMAKLMGYGDLTAQVKFSYLNNGKFTMMGNLGEMEMKTLNPILERNAMVLVDEGRIKSVNFNFAAGLKSASGSMVFKYNNLHVKILDQKTQRSNAIKERVTSLLANNFIINDNPASGKPPKKVKLYYERNPNRFIFNYTWKILLSGIKETIGLNAIKS